MYSLQFEKKNPYIFVFLSYRRNFLGTQNRVRISHGKQAIGVRAVVGISVQKKGKRKVQGVPQSQTAALPRHQEEEETDKSKQAQIEQSYEKH